MPIVSGEIITLSGFSGWVQRVVSESLDCLKGPTGEPHWLIMSHVPNLAKDPYLGSGVQILAKC